MLGMHSPYTEHEYDRAALIGKVLAALPYLNETQAGDVAELLGNPIAEKIGWLARLKENALQEAMAIEKDPVGTAKGDEADIPLNVRLRRVYQQSSEALLELEREIEGRVSEETQVKLKEVLFPALGSQRDDYNMLLQAVTMADYAGREKILEFCTDEKNPAPARGLLMGIFPGKEFPGKTGLVAEYRRVARRLVKSGTKPPRPHREFAEIRCCGATAKR